MSANPSRRKMIQTSVGTALGAGVLRPGHIAAEQKKEKKLRWEFCTFTKPLQNLSYDESSRLVAEAGYQGVEAPVRPGGHVLPERVEDDLPKLMEALKKHQLNMTVLTSRINEVSDEQFSEKVLRTAAELGVKRFRMAYYYYNVKQPILPQLNEFKAKLKDLVAMTSELGIKPVYQNHSGSKYFGAPIWDLHEIFSEFDPKDLGVAFDIGHAYIEGAKAWPLNFALIRPYIDTIYIKEPHWDDNKVAWGPIGKGALDKGFFKTLKADSFDGPISIHIEYLKERVPEVVPALSENLDAVRKLLS